MTQQTEELESASAKIKELEAKTKELESKNEEATASIEKFSQSNKELATQLDELNKECMAEVVKGPLGIDGGEETSTFGAKEEGGTEWLAASRSGTAGEEEGAAG